LYGTTDNAVKIPVWIAGRTCVLVAFIRKRPSLEASMHETRPTPKQTPFEESPFDELAVFHVAAGARAKIHNQLNSFE
jgi:hypothetical protein